MERHKKRVRFWVILQGLLGDQSVLTEKGAVNDYAAPSIPDYSAASKIGPSVITGFLEPSNSCQGDWTLGGTKAYGHVNGRSYIYYKLQDVDFLSLVRERCTLSSTSGNSKAQKVYIMRKKSGSEPFGVLKRLIAIPWSICKDSLPVMESKHCASKLHVLTEYYMGSVMKHPNINAVEYLYLVEDSKAKESVFYVISKYAGPLTLSKLRLKTLSRESREHLACSIFVQILNGLRYIHKKHEMIHADLKGGNIVVKWNTSDSRSWRPITAKLIDFEYMAPLGQCYGSRGTYRFKAPELENSRMATAEVDIWALGVTLFQLLTGIYPFKICDKSTYKKAVQNFVSNVDTEAFDVRKLLEESCKIRASMSIEAIDLLQKMLAMAPHNRISLDEMYEHPWIKKYYSTSGGGTPVLFREDEMQEIYELFKESGTTHMSKTDYIKSRLAGGG